MDLGRGATSNRLIVPQIILPPDDAWESRGNHNLQPSGQWLSAAIGAAIDTGSGLAFVHSHPDSYHPSELSWIDKATSKDWARTLVPGVVARHVNALGLGTSAEPYAADVRTDEVARRLLDLDLVISTTDTHSSRALVNQVAFQYYVPVIDVGVKVGTATDGSVSGMPVEIRLLLPDEPCLWCRGVLDAERIREENLPADERRRLRAEGYIQGVDRAQPSIAALNSVGASIAATLALQLATDHEVALSTLIFDPWELYLQPIEVAIDPECLCRHWRGRADATALPTW